MTAEPCALYAAVRIPYPWRNGRPTKGDLLANESLSSKDCLIPMFIRQRHNAKFRPTTGHYLKLKFLNTFTLWDHIARSTWREKMKKKFAYEIRKIEQYQMDM